MANDFRAQIGGYRASAMQNAMATMAGDSGFDAVTAKGLQSGLDNRQRAIEKASAWTNRGISAVGGMGDFMNKMGGEAMQQGLQAKASHLAYQEQKKAMEAQKKSNGLGGILGIASSVAGLFLCERRLKQDIAPLPPADAWSLVRDLPYYSFEYKAVPGRTAYGPMIDEVEQLDPSLVRPTLLPADEEGPIRGFDVMRHQAYETIALQQALQRIEQLEARLARLEAPASPPAAWQQRPALVAA
jgi:hypothetical protein